MVVNTQEDTKVRDHCQLTGQCCGSAYQICNLNFVLSTRITVIFHNLHGYDYLIIMQQIGQVVKDTAWVNEKGVKKENSINVIPNNMAKYMTFMLGKHLVFMDSFQFMGISLSKLIKNLPREALKYTGREFRDKRFNLMTRKGIYQYDYMDSFKKFNET